MYIFVHYIHVYIYIYIPSTALAGEWRTRGERGLGCRTGRDGCFGQGLWIIPR